MSLDLSIIFMDDVSWLFEQMRNSLQYSIFLFNSKTLGSHWPLFAKSSERDWSFSIALKFCSKISKTVCPK